MHWLHSFSVILFISSSSLYLVRSNYNKTNALIQKSNCSYSPKSNEYICDLVISYEIDDDKIINQIIIKSSKRYKAGDIIEIEYDANNFFNVSHETFYKDYAILSSLSGIVLLLLAFHYVKEIKENTIDKINNLLSFITDIKIW